MVESAVLESSLPVHIVGEMTVLTSECTAKCQSTDRNMFRKSNSRFGGVPQHHSTNRSLTDTDASVQAHRHPGHALAAERPLRVDASTIHAHSRGLAFIDVCGRDSDIISS